MQASLTLRIRRGAVGRGSARATGRDDDSRRATPVAQERAPTGSIRGPRGCTGLPAAHGNRDPLSNRDGG
jgi:hypothetical protein